MKKFKKHIHTICAINLLLSFALLWVCPVSVKGENHNIIPISDGDTVKITKGTKYEYGGYYTNEYWIHADGFQFLGSCAEPVKPGPEGQSFVAAKATDPIFRYLMWCYQSDEFREEAFGAVEKEQQFILLHTTLGYYYCGEQGFGEVENVGKQWMDAAKDVLHWIRTVFYKSEEERYVKARTAAKNMFDTYIAWGGETYQDIVWIQPKYVDLQIFKRSAEDLQGGEKYLSGAVFELYAWDGTSYSKKISESLDCKDGTYIFENIHYMQAVDGKFLVVESVAPEGYEKPYCFYDEKDRIAYETYGGREFQLDKSYMEWSCDSEFGFTFYNQPVQNGVLLPATGSYMTLICFGMGATLMVGILVLDTREKIKKKR